MGIGASVFLIAIGAILAFAVTVNAEGFNLNTIGWILMIVGVIGAILSFAFWTRRPTGHHHEHVIERDRT